MVHKSILIVDDESHIINVLALKLRNAQFEVHTASNGEEALKQAESVKPDLVITDYSMPVMNGLELVKQLRSQEPTQNLPVIMLTARGQNVEEDDGDAPKIDLLMSKPFSPREILQKVQMILGGE